MNDDELFGHLDDPGAPAPSREALDTVVRRGRQIRSRRRSIIAASSAAAVALLAVGGIGVSRAFDAQDHQSPVDVLQTPSGTASATPTRSPDPGPRTFDPGALGPAGTAPPVVVPPPVPPDPCASSTPSPADDGIDPSATTSPGADVEATAVPVAPSPDTTCPTTSPTVGPSETASPAPTDTAQPTASASVTATAAVAPSAAG
jgi:hypothetical protein